MTVMVSVLASDHDRLMAFEVVEKMKAEILRMMDDGTIPYECPTFSDLHSYLDANELGDFCKDDGPHTRITHAGDHDAEILFMNTCQDAVNNWLQNRLQIPRKTRPEINKLKRDWENDPNWDLEDTEGFERHRAELHLFALVTDRDYNVSEVKRLREAVRGYNNAVDMLRSV